MFKKLKGFVTQKFGVNPTSRTKTKSMIKSDFDIENYTEEEIIRLNTTFMNMCFVNQIRDTLIQYDISHSELDFKPDQKDIDELIEFISQAFKEEPTVEETGLFLDLLVNVK